MKLFFLIISIFLVCNGPKSHGGMSHPNHQTNKKYTPFIPPGYKYTPQRGLDSFIGDISNDTIKFSFDYGMYSNRGPMSQKDLKDQLLQESNLNELKEDCQWKHISRTDLIKNLKVISIFENPNFPGTSTMEIAVSLSYTDDQCTIFMRPSQSDMIAKMNNHQFIEEESKRLTSKIYYPKDSSSTFAGLFIQENKNINKLTIYTRDFNTKNAADIIQYLKGARDAYK